MKGILDTLGAEVTGAPLDELVKAHMTSGFICSNFHMCLSLFTGIVAPVSICMALTVLLVRLLNPSGDSESTALLIVSAYYSEKVGTLPVAAMDSRFPRKQYVDWLQAPGNSSPMKPIWNAQADDSTGTKLAGSLVNALIFVAIVAAMTFVLFLLFKYGVGALHAPSHVFGKHVSFFQYHAAVIRWSYNGVQYVRFIYGYMGVAGFSIFFFLTGVIVLQLLEKLQRQIEDKLKEVLEDYLEIDPNPDLYKLKFSTLVSKNSTIVKFKGKDLAFLWNNIIKWMQKNDPGNEPYQCQIDKVASPT